KPNRNVRYVPRTRFPVLGCANHISHTKAAVKADLLAPLVDGTESEQTNIEIRIRGDFAFQHFDDWLRDRGKIRVGEGVRLAAEHLRNLFTEFKLAFEIHDEQIAFVGLGARN